MGTKVKNLQLWCKKMADGYHDVEVKDMTASWKSGLAFCAIIHRFRPDLIDYDALSKENVFDNNNLAFEVAEKELSIPAFLDAADMVAIRVPDRLSVVTYVSQYYNYFHNKPQLGGPGVRKPGSLKRAPSEDISQGPEPKRFTPNKQDNDNKPIKQQGTMGDKCTICHEKVYLLERQMENGKLYHRTCFRQSEMSPTRKIYNRPDVVTPSKNETKPEPNFWQRRAEAKKGSNTPVVPKVTSTVKPIDSKKDAQGDNKKDTSGGKQNEENSPVPFWKKSHPGNLDLHGANVKGDKTNDNRSASPKPSPRHVKHEKTKVNDDKYNRKVETMDVSESENRPKPTPRGNLKRNEVKPQDLKSVETPVTVPLRKGRCKSPNLSSPESPPPLPSTKPPSFLSPSVPSLPDSSPTKTSSVLSSGNISSPRSGDYKTHIETISHPDRPKSSPSWLKSTQQEAVKPTVLNFNESPERPVSKFSPVLSPRDPSKLPSQSSPVAPKSSPRNRNESRVSNINEKSSPRSESKAVALEKPARFSPLPRRTTSPMEIDEIMKMQDEKSREGETVAVLVSPTSPPQSHGKDKNVLSGLLKNLANVRKKDDKHTDSSERPDSSGDKLDKNSSKPKHQGIFGSNINSKTTETRSDKPVTSYIAKSDNSEIKQGEKQPRVKAVIASPDKTKNKEQNTSDKNIPTCVPRIKTTVPTSDNKDKKTEDKKIVQKPRVQAVIGQKQSKNSDKVEREKMEIEIDKVNDNIPEWKRRLEESRKAFGAKTSQQVTKQDPVTSGSKENKKSEPESTKNSESLDKLNVKLKKPPRPKTPEILHKKTEEPSKPLWQLEAEKRAEARKMGYVDPEKNKDGKAPSPVLGIKEKVNDSVEKDKKSDAKRRVLPTIPVESQNSDIPDVQRKKIPLGIKFNFDADKHEESPKTPPPRPPPPSPGVDFGQRRLGKGNQTPTPPRSSLRRKEVEGDTNRISPMEIQKQLMDIDSRLTNLELRGRQLEDSIRKEEEEDEDMMIEWFHLVNEKNELVRNEADLIYRSRAQELEDEQQDIDKQIRELMSKPVGNMTEEEKEEEAILLQKLVDVVNQRSLIVDSQDEDRIRYLEEDKDIAAMLEAKGFTKDKQKNRVEL